MSKLGYTWYPKDWGNSDAVFELLLDERGMFRELIDMAMLNDNKTEIKNSLWCRKFAVSEEDLERILITLEDKNLIVIEGYNLFIPSCEKRLILVRAGAKGGKKSKPIPKPLGKPIPKPNAKQKEREKKRKEIEVYRKFKHLSISKNEFTKLESNYTKEQIDNILDSIENYSKNTSYNSLYLTAIKWLKREYPESVERKETPEEALERKRKEADRF